MSKTTMRQRHDRMERERDKKEILAAETVGERARIALEKKEEKRRKGLADDGWRFSRKVFLEPLPVEHDWVFLLEEKLPSPVWHLDGGDIDVSFSRSEKYGPHFLVVERCSKCEYVGVAGVFRDLGGLGLVLDKPEDWECPRCNPKKALQKKVLSTPHEKAA